MILDQKPTLVCMYDRILTELIISAMTLFPNMRLYKLGLENIFLGEIQFNPKQCLIMKDNYCGSEKSNMVGNFH